MTYRNVDGGDDAQTTEIKPFTANADVEVDAPGTYEIVHVVDADCPGSPDENANRFEVVDIPRPLITIADSPLLEKDEAKYMKKGVCEGMRILWS